MALKDRIDSKQQAAYGNKDAVPSSSPSSALIIDFSTKSNTLKRRKKRLHTITMVTTIVGSVLALLFASIYLPQLFIDDPKAEEEPINYNSASIQIRKSYIENNPTEDFDNDGLSNSAELLYGTSVFNVDTDGDGIADGKDFDPLKKNRDIYQKLKEDGYQLSSAYTMNGVILWPDNESSCMYGGVMQTISGAYYFTDFIGWAKFPDGSYAYKYENGVHTLLEYRKKENAWYIDSDCFVVVTDKEPEHVHQFHIFGNRSYVQDGAWGSFLSSVLPNKGWLTCRKMWLDDTFISAPQLVTVNVKSEEYTYSKDDSGRFRYNDTSLDNLTALYTAIKKNNPVLVSLNSDAKGESVFFVYGYDAEGNLLIKTLDGNFYGAITIYPRCTRTINGAGVLSERKWFDFKGAGFDSSKNDTIHFFEAVKISKDEENDEEVSEPPEHSEVSEDTISSDVLEVPER